MSEVPNSRLNLFKNKTTSLKYKSKGRQRIRIGAAIIGAARLKMEAKIPRIISGGTVQRIIRLEITEIGE